MDIGILRWGVGLFWGACVALILLGAILAGWLARGAFQADRRRRALVRQELIWILVPALLVVGLAVMSDLIPSSLHHAPAALAR